MHFEVQGGQASICGRCLSSGQQPAALTDTAAAPGGQTPLTMHTALPSPQQKPINRTLADYERVGELKFGLLVSWLACLHACLAASPATQRSNAGYYSCHDYPCSLSAGVACQPEARCLPAGRRGRGRGRRGRRPAGCGGAPAGGVQGCAEVSE